MVGREAGRASCGSLRRPTESPQVRAAPVIPTGSPHTKRNSTAHRGTVATIVLTVLTSGNAAEQAMDALAFLVSARDRAPEKRKVGGSTPPLTTAFYLRERAYSDRQCVNRDTSSLVLVSFISL
jgi:hypothetical protein